MQNSAVHIVSWPVQDLSTATHQQVVRIVICGKQV